MTVVVRAGNRTGEWPAPPGSLSDAYQASLKGHTVKKKKKSGEASIPAAHILL